MTCFTTRHIQGGGGVRATFFNSEGAKINDSLGPPSVRPPGYAPENLLTLIVFQLKFRHTCLSNSFTRCKRRKRHVDNSWFIFLTESRATKGWGPVTPVNMIQYRRVHTNKVSQHIFHTHSTVFLIHFRHTEEHNLRFLFSMSSSFAARSSFSCCNFSISVFHIL